MNNLEPIHFIDVSKIKLETSDYEEPLEDPLALNFEESSASLKKENVTGFSDIKQEKEDEEHCSDMEEYSVYTSAQMSIDSNSDGASIIDTLRAISHTEKENHYTENNEDDNISIETLHYCEQEIDQENKFIKKTNHEIYTNTEPQTMDCLETIKDGSIAFDVSHDESFNSKNSMTPEGQLFIDFNSQNYQYLRSKVEENYDLTNLHNRKLSHKRRIAKNKEKSQNLKSEIPNITTTKDEVQDLKNIKKNIYFNNSIVKVNCHRDLKYTSKHYKENYIKQIEILKEIDFPDLLSKNSCVKPVSSIELERGENTTIENKIHNNKTAVENKIDNSSLTKSTDKKDNFFEKKSESVTITRISKLERTKTQRNKKPHTENIYINENVSPNFNTLKNESMKEINNSTNSVNKTYKRNCTIPVVRREKNVNTDSSCLKENNTKTSSTLSDNTKNQLFTHNPEKSKKNDDSNISKETMNDSLKNKKANHKNNYEGNFIKRNASLQNDKSDNKLQPYLNSIKNKNSIQISQVQARREKIDSAGIKQDSNNIKKRLKIGNNVLKTFKTSDVKNVTSKNEIILLNLPLVDAGEAIKVITKSNTLTISKSKNKQKHITQKLCKSSQKKQKANTSGNLENAIKCNTLSAGKLWLKNKLFNNNQIECIKINEIPQDPDKNIQKGKIGDPPIIPKETTLNISLEKGVLNTNQDAKIPHTKIVYEIKGAEIKEGTIEGKNKVQENHISIDDFEIQKNKLLSLQHKSILHQNASLLQRHNVFIQPTNPSIQPTNPSIQPPNHSIQPTNPSIQPTNPSTSVNNISIQLNKPSIKPTNPSIQLNNPSIQVNNPSIQLNNPSIQLNNPSIQLNNPSIQQNNPSIKQNKLSIQQNNPSIQLNNPSIQLNNPSIQLNNPLVQQNNSSIQLNNPSIQQNNPSIQLNTPSIKPNNPSIQLYNPSIQPTNPLIQPPNPSIPLKNTLTHPTNSSNHPTNPSNHPTNPSNHQTNPSNHQTNPSNHPTKYSIHPNYPSIKTNNLSIQSTNTTIQPTNPSIHLTNPSIHPTNPLIQTNNPSIRPKSLSMQLNNPLIQPTNHLIQPTNPLIQPNNSIIQPSNPSIQLTNPSILPTNPSILPTNPSILPTNPSNYSSNPSDHLSYPSDHSSNPSNHLTNPSMHPTNPSNYPTYPSIHPTYPLIQPINPLIQTTNPSIQPTNPSIQPTNPLIQPPNPLIQPPNPLIQPPNPLIHPSNPLIEPSNYLLQSNTSLLKPNNFIIEFADPIMPSHHILSKSNNSSFVQNSIFEQKDSKETTEKTTRIEDGDDYDQTEESIYNQGLKKETIISQKNVIISNQFVNKHENKTSLSDQNIDLSENNVIDIQDEITLIQDEKTLPVKITSLTKQIYPLFQEERTENKQKRNITNEKRENDHNDAVDIQKDISTDKQNTPRSLVKSKSEKIISRDLSLKSKQVAFIHRDMDNKSEISIEQCKNNNINKQVFSIRYSETKRKPHEDWISEPICGSELTKPTKKIMKYNHKNIPFKFSNDSFQQSNNKFNSSKQTFFNSDIRYDYKNRMSRKKSHYIYKISKELKRLASQISNRIASKPWNKHFSQKNNLQSLRLNSEYDVDQFIPKSRHNEEKECITCAKNDYNDPQENFYSSDCLNNQNMFNANNFSYYRGENYSNNNDSFNIRDYNQYQLNFNTYPYYSGTSLFNYSENNFEEHNSPCVQNKLLNDNQNNYFDNHQVMNYFSLQSISPFSPYQVPYSYYSYDQLYYLNNIFGKYYYNATNFVPDDQQMLKNQQTCFNVKNCKNRYDDNFKIHPLDPRFKGKRTCMGMKKNELNQDELISNYHKTAYDQLTSVNRYENATEVLPEASKTNYSNSNQLGSINVENFNPLSNEFKITVNEKRLNEKIPFEKPVSKTKNINTFKEQPLKNAMTSDKQKTDFYTKVNLEELKINEKTKIDDISDKDKSGSLKIDERFLFTEMQDEGNYQIANEIMNNNGTMSSNIDLGTKQTPIKFKNKVNIIEDLLFKRELLSSVNDSEESLALSVRKLLNDLSDPQDSNDYSFSTLNVVKKDVGKNENYCSKYNDIFLSLLTLLDENAFSANYCPSKSKTVTNDCLKLDLYCNTHKSESIDKMAYIKFGCHSATELLKNITNLNKPEYDSCLNNTTFLKNSKQIKSFTKKSLNSLHNNKLDANNSVEEKEECNRNFQETVEEKTLKYKSKSDTACAMVVQQGENSESELKKSIKRSKILNKHQKSYKTMKETLKKSQSLKENICYLENEELTTKENQITVYEQHNESLFSSNSPSFAENLFSKSCNTQIKIDTVSLSNCDSKRNDMELKACSNFSKKNKTTSVNIDAELALKTNAPTKNNGRRSIKNNILELTKKYNFITPIEPGYQTNGKIPNNDPLILNNNKNFIAKTNEILQNLDMKIEKCFSNTNNEDIMTKTESSNKYEEKGVHVIRYEHFEKNIPLNNIYPIDLTENYLFKKKDREIDIKDNKFLPLKTDQIMSAANKKEIMSLMTNAILTKNDYKSSFKKVDSSSLIINSQKNEQESRVKIDVQIRLNKDNRKLSQAIHYKEPSSESTNQSANKNQIVFNDCSSKNDEKPMQNINELSLENKDTISSNDDNVYTIFENNPIIIKINHEKFDTTKITNEESDMHKALNSETRTLSSIKKCQTNNKLISEETSITENDMSKSKNEKKLNNNEVMSLLKSSISSQKGDKFNLDKNSGDKEPDKNSPKNRMGPKDSQMFPLSADKIVIKSDDQISTYKNKRLLIRTKKLSDKKKCDIISQQVFPTNFKSCANRNERGSIENEQIKISSNQKSPTKRFDDQKNQLLSNNFETVSHNENVMEKNNLIISSNTINVLNLNEKLDTSSNYELTKNDNRRNKENDLKKASMDVKTNETFSIKNKESISERNCSNTSVKLNKYFAPKTTEENKLNLALKRHMPPKGSKNMSQNNDTNTSTKNAKKMLKEQDKIKKQDTNDLKIKYSQIDKSSSLKTIYYENRSNKMSTKLFSPEIHCSKSFTNDKEKTPLKNRRISMNDSSGQSNKSIPDGVNEMNNSFHKLLSEASLHEKTRKNEVLIHPVFMGSTVSNNKLTKPGKRQNIDKKPNFISPEKKKKINSPRTEKYSSIPSRRVTIKKKDEELTMKLKKEIGYCDSHEKKPLIICHICSFKTENTSEWMLHFKKVHKANYLYCSFCGFSIRDKNKVDNMRDHIHTTHLKPRFFKCALCSYATRKSFSLKQHMHLHRKY